MPFKKVGPDQYVSPSGRKWTGAQVKKYYATDGFTKGEPKASVNPKKTKSKPPKGKKAT